MNDNAIEKYFVSEFLSRQGIEDNNKSDFLNVLRLLPPVAQTGPWIAGGAVALSPKRTAMKRLSVDGANS